MSTPKQSCHRTINELKTKSLHKLDEIDINKLLFEKNEAMKDLEFLENDDNDNSENEQFEIKKYKIHEQKDLNHNNENIIIVSDRSCQGFDSILEKNLVHLESIIKKSNTVKKKKLH